MLGLAYGERAVKFVAGCKRVGLETGVVTGSGLDVWELRVSSRDIGGGISCNN